MWDKNDSCDLWFWYTCFLGNMVSFIAFDEVYSKLLFQCCTPSFWNILKRKFDGNDEFDELSRNNKVSWIIFKKVENTYIWLRFLEFFVNILLDFLVWLVFHYNEFRVLLFTYSIWCKYKFMFSDKTRHKLPRPFYRHCYSFPLRKIGMYLTIHK